LIERPPRVVTLGDLDDRLKKTLVGALHCTRFRRNTNILRIEFV